jgi:ribonuclease PH
VREGRRPDELRQVEIVPGFLEQAQGSALISIGATRVLCTATVEDGVPRWMEAKGEGWLTAEYGMLPASAGQRIRREATAGRQKGRTVEIQRLIGRAIRGGYDLRGLGERTLWLDCDVLQADGGTRTAAVTGAWVALVLAAREVGFTEPEEQIAAVSLGIVDGELLLDLDYREDSSADVDMNVVMTASGRIIDIQATAEREPFTHERLDELVVLARSGIGQIAEEQRRAVDAS